MMKQANNIGPSANALANNAGSIEADDIPCIDSAELFGNNREIRISHRGELYRMRITAQQKLILTK